MANSQIPVSGSFQGRNAFLGALSPESLSKLQRHMEFVDLPLHHILRSAGRNGEFVYFLNEGLASLVIHSQDGGSAEVGVVGKESVVGAPAALGVAKSPVTEIMQVAGNGFRISPARMREVVVQDREVASLLMRHATVLGLQVAQIAGCNALHTAEQRLSRWMLMVNDRAPVNPIPLTHEFLSFLLGVTRPSVTVTLNGIAKKGAIRQEREGVRILDREALERCCSCECYRVIAGLSVGADD